MTTSQQQRLIAATPCSVAFDNLTRILHATDASIYEIEPFGVAFPRNAAEAGAVIGAAAEAGMSVIPRGAGTGLVGGALGEGLIVEFSRHNRQIDQVDLDRRSVRVGAGVVLDQLNTFLKPVGFCFGPDVATSSRATIGGMIANNSSGSHVPVYGTTADHVTSVEIVLADGRLREIGAGHNGLPDEQRVIKQLVEEHAPEIRHRMPPGLLKRWPGYGLSRYLLEPAHLHHVLAGSEGTLAAILSAELRIVPLPKSKGLALIFFARVADAMQATVELTELKPAAIEHVDRVLFDQTKGQIAFKAARDLLQLDAKPCESMLIVEFYDDIQDRLAAVARKNLGQRTMVLTSMHEMNLVWSMRKAGLSLLTGCKGPAKPVTGVEDAAVRPEQLPAYFEGLQSIFKPLGLQACYYGHAATGLLHVRPVLDLHSADDRRKFRQVAEEVSALVRQFKGSLAAEHGVGIARTEFMREHLGDELLDLLRQIKMCFDPTNRFNPGKIFDGARFKIDTQLRIETGREITLPFVPVLAFAAKDESFLGNLEQCNGCGGCRKESPTMCPTFLATGDEVMSTRGRANIIRAALERKGIADPLDSPELETALSNCLSCKACTAECPSNVNLALLKAELLHARYQRDGLPLRQRLLSSVDALGRIGTLAPGLANAVLASAPIRALLARVVGLSSRRPLPRYAPQRFDHWFKASRRRGVSSRGRVMLWDDTFVRYHEPHLGIAAVKVLEAAGFEVVLLQDRRCCGRPAFSQGNLTEAARLGRHNLELLAQPSARNIPLLFLEPSCYSMFAEDYRELKLPAADEIRERCWLFEHFMEDLLRRAPDALRFEHRAENVVIHAHCHAKSLLNIGFMPQLAQRLPGRTVTLLDSGCCGMAGAFGALKEKYDLSLQIAQPLVEKVRAQPPGTTVVACGTSCRHQIDHLTDSHPVHMAEVLAGALSGASALWK